MAGENKKRQNEGNEDSGKGLPQKNKLEWTVFGLSFLLVLLIIGYLVYQAFTARPSTPDVYVRLREDPSVNDPFRYRLSITNQGGQTAEEVKIEAAMMQGGWPVETSELELPFSPRWSEREGWINFSKDPATADSITVRIVSYKSP